MTGLLDVATLTARLEALTGGARKEAEALVAALTAGPQAEVGYRLRPVQWAVDRLGVSEASLRWSMSEGYAGHEWDGDRDPLLKVFEAVAAGEDVGIESGTGTGKSFAVAVVVLWFLACWEGAQVYTFAPKEDQLKLFIWRQIAEFFPRFKERFPTAELTDLTLRMRGGIDESWAAHGYAVGVKAGEAISTKASGMHGKDMLLVYEEMQGCPVPVILAGENTCTAPHNLRIGLGNPNHRLDPLHRFCTSAGVTAVRMSALDHPNVVTGNPNLVPGAVALPSILKRKLEYGETSPVYQSRVRGLSPDQATDALIRLEWLERAAARFEARGADRPSVVTGKGVDVANSEHGDQACIVDFCDNLCTRIDPFPCPDANALGRKVAQEMADLDPKRVGVDGIGVGAGTVNELRRLGKSVQALYASAKPMPMAEKLPDGGRVEWGGDANLFLNLRSQMYWQAREDLRTEVIDVPKDILLWEELTCPTFADDPKTTVEAKEDIRARLGRSPDRADAFVMANWVRERRPLLERPNRRNVPPGTSPGYDYLKHTPRTRETGDEALTRLLGVVPASPIAGKYHRPWRP